MHNIKKLQTLTQAETVQLYNVMQKEKVNDIPVCHGRNSWPHQLRMASLSKNPVISTLHFHHGRDGICI